MKQYMKGSKKYFFFLVSILLCHCFMGSHPLQAQRIIDLTLQSAVEIAMDNSYRVRQLQLSVERQRKWLEAERADLKSRAYMNLKAPQISQLSDLLQTITRQRDTELNFLNVYLGYRKSLLTLMKYTYYDYENDISLLERFGISK